MSEQSYLEARHLARILTQVWLARMALQGLLLDAQENAGNAEEHDLLHRTGIACDQLLDAERILGESIAKRNEKATP